MNNSSITHTTPEDAQRTFLAFREECIWLRICYNTYADLYDSGDQVIETLSVTANIFFGDLSRILSEYFCLQACKITDPEKTCGKPNLTVDHINVLLRESNLMTDDIDRYSSELHHYRDLVVGARNRLIAHSDREAVLKGRRDHMLAGLGVRVVRVWNAEIREDLGGVLRRIYAVVQERAAEMGRLDDTGGPTPACGHPSGGGDLPGLRPPTPACGRPSGGGDC